MPAATTWTRPGVLAARPWLGGLARASWEGDYGRGTTLGGEGNMIFDWLRDLVSSSSGAGSGGAKDHRVKERRGRPRDDQGFTKDGRKDMRGRQA